MAPLYSLTAGNGKFDWQPEHEAIRRQLVSVLTNEPVLSIFDPDRETELHTDASAIGYGGALIQKVESVPHVVAYYSRRTTSAESKFLKKNVEPKQVHATAITKNWLLAEQQRDSDIMKLISDLTDGNLNEDVAKTYELRSGTLYRKIQRNGKTRCLPVLPRSLR
ncbi:unnamed protein product [Euphydryas editha]|uniref:Reverse transcriptase/retrotransposon-derived protein RNase H-like domain-containing protein n=1 Tax=Euphydryas editha TaxID=104508 RepID=A0AAU9TJS5_EUPED|nr:unnamed protein product [Euphydryas editha]